MCNREKALFEWFIDFEIDQGRSCIEFGSKTSFRKITLTGSNLQGRVSCIVRRGNVRAQDQGASKVMVPAERPSASLLLQRSLTNDEESSSLQLDSGRQVQEHAVDGIRW